MEQERDNTNSGDVSIFSPTYCNKFGFGTEMRTLVAILKLVMSYVKPLSLHKNAALDFFRSCDSTLRKNPKAY